MASLRRTEFDAEIDRLLSKAEASIPDEMLPDLPPMRSCPEVHEWHDFEGSIWATGEEIRHVIGRYQQSFNDNQIQRILRICQDKRAKRGRQSFVMLLGRKKFCGCSDALIPLLMDADVHGHVIETLYKMQADGYHARITPFLNHKQTWIRNAAKKYLQKFAEADPEG